MALNVVTLTWDLTDLIQSGLQATLVITPTVQLTDPVDHLVFPAVARTVSFYGTGQLPGIVANDNSDISPFGSTYTISVTAASGQVIVQPFNAQINFANGATQDLSSLMPVSGLIPVILNDLDGGSAAAGILPAGSLDGGDA